MNFKHLLLASTALILVGCGGRPDEKVDRQISSKSFAEASQWLEQEVKDNPRDPLVNGLYAEVLAHQCAEEAYNCLSEDITNFAKIEELLKNVSKPIKVGGDLTRDIYDNLAQVAEKYIAHKTHPLLLIKFVQSLPENTPKERFVEILLSVAEKALENNNTQKAALLFETAAEISPENSGTQHLSSFLKTTLTGDLEARNLHVEYLASKNPVISNNTLRAIPYVLYNGMVKQNPQSGALQFANSFEQEIMDLNILNLATENAKQIYADVLVKMADSTEFLERAVDHAKILEKSIEQTEVKAETPDVDETVGVIKGLETPNTAEADLFEEDVNSIATMLRLRFLKQALVFNPDQPDVWKAFLQPAMDHVDQTGDTNLLFIGINQDKIPAEELAPYNKRLFNLVDTKLAAKENALPLLEKIVVPTEKGAAVERKIEAILKSALEGALDRGQAEIMVAYAGFKPELAKPYRQQIVTLTIKEMESMWSRDEFDHMQEYASFLTEKMGIDFDLNNLLLQSFNTYAEANGIKDALHASTPDILLKPQTDVALSFGKKFDFLAEHFKGNRNLLDNQLKSTLAQATGRYGVATALYRMYDLFSDKTFPQRERKEFLLGSIKKSIDADETIDAVDMSRIGYELSQRHPGISILFIIGETLKRIETLDEARNVWQQASNEFKTSLKNVRPQFTTLMEAIELFENGNRSKAAELFNILSDDQYLLQAEPYFKAYKDMVADFEGVYISEDTDKQMHTLLMFITPSSTVEEAKAEAAEALKEKEKQRLEALKAEEEAADAEKKVTSEDKQASDAEVDEEEEETNEEKATPKLVSAENLLDLDITFINAVGSVLVRSNNQLVEDYGRTFRHTIRSEMNPDNMTVPVPEEQRAVAPLPQSFERTFGEITNLKFNENGTINVEVAATKKKYSFRRISQRTNYPLFPKGRYGVTKQTSGNDPNFDHVLPTGSIVDIEIDRDRPLQPVQKDKKLSIVYPLKGTLWHPAANEPRTIKGYYTLNTHTINFAYSYPFGDNQGSLDAVAKCHAVDSELICAAHNKHWSRRRFSHIVTGKKAAKGASIELEDGILSPPSLP